MGVIGSGQREFGAVESFEMTEMAPHEPKIMLRNCNCTMSVCLDEGAPHDASRKLGNQRFLSNI